MEEISKKQDAKRHIIIKKYLSEHSLVESNIASFNDFIENRMQQIVSELSEASSEDEETQIKLGKIKVEKPNVVEADGSSTLLMPAESRLRNLTYSAPIFVEITVKQGPEIETHNVEVGRIPVLVKSNGCNIANMSREELIKNNIDPADPGGYFLINGNERVMVMTEDLAANQPFIERSKNKLTLRVFSQRGSYRIPTTISESSDGILELSFSRLKNIPIIIILKSLGLTKESEIAKYIGKESDSIIVNLYEFANIHTSEEALLKITENESFQGTQKEILDRIKQRIDSFLLPHIGLTKSDRIEKAITLCKLIKQFVVAKESPTEVTDKDHYANKRVRLSGDLLADLFRVNLNILLRDIKHSLQKISKRKKFYSIKTIAKSTLFSHRMESAIATGSWIGEKTGVTQNMDKTNYLAVLSQLQRVSSMLAGEQENFLARTLHPTHYGRFCPIETPEGTEIGLRKNLAILSRISTNTLFDDAKFMAQLEKMGLQKGLESSGKDVFFNGKFIGYILNEKQFVEDIKKKRRSLEFPMELSIRYDKKNEIVYLSTEPGRVLRPLIIVEKGASKMKDEHIVLLEQGKITWSNLIEQGIIEYLDAAEEENALVALNQENITPEHTHLEIDKVDLFGLVTSLVPYVNHDQSPRMIRGSKTQKQALGLYAANYLCRLDTDVSLLHYPQKPLVRSFIYDTVKIYPTGQNMVVAVMTYQGYNIHDALILNKGSIERALGRSTYFRPYTSTELNYAGGLKDAIEIPGKDIRGYKTEESYRYLEDDGIVFTEADLKEGEVLIGKTSPPKFLSEAGEIAIKTRKENSTSIRQEEQGTVDAVFITTDDQGNRIVQVRTRDERKPEIGDKFATTHGQKGVVGYILPEEDVPFTSRGMRPDIIFNPHGIPGRMTVGYLIELIAGKSGAMSGKIIDGTAFSSASVEEIEKTLKEYGFRFDGKETMYDGITGKMLEAKIYIGNMHYMKLKYMVSNKLHARASGKVTLLTRQPTEGRARGGALRLGEMEQQALVAHGASLLLKERYSSDRTVIPICTKCGAIGIKDSLRNKTFCPVCDSNEIEEVEVSYAFKLLVEELQSLHIMTHFELKNKYEQ
jgi:DNA-directed RNA polymerase subunit B